MKRVLIVTSAIVVMSVFPAIAQQNKCYPTCNQTFHKWNKTLNEVWREEFTKEDREKYKPIQNRWVKYRDDKCLNKGKYKDQCLIDETYLRIQELWDVATFGEFNADDFKPSQLQKDCVAGGGGLSCYNKW